MCDIIAIGQSQVELVFLVQAHLLKAFVWFVVSSHCTFATHQQQHKYAHKSSQIIVWLSLFAAASEVYLMPYWRRSRFMAAVTQKFRSAFFPKYNSRLFDNNCTQVIFELSDSISLSTQQHVFTYVYYNRQVLTRSELGRLLSARMEKP